MKKVFIFLFLFPSIVLAATKEAPFDPTRNVLQLVEAAVKRLDDIQTMNNKAIEEKLTLYTKALNEKIDIFIETSKALNKAEKSRVDAIRDVDVNAAKIARERDTSQAQLLASQVQITAENLRLLVVTTAEATAKQNLAIVSDLSKRMVEIEKVQNAASGAFGGIKDMWGWIFGVAALLFMLGKSLFVTRMKENGK